MVPDKIEKEYCEMLKSEIAKYDNMYFLDFYNNRIDSLTGEDFHDIVHLTDKGAEIFSRKITEELLAKGLIK